MLQSRELANRREKQTVRQRVEITSVLLLFSLCSHRLKQVQEDLGLEEVSCMMLGFRLRTFGTKSLDCS